MVEVQETKDSRHSLIHDLILWFVHLVGTLLSNAYKLTCHHILTGYVPRSASSHTIGCLFNFKGVLSCKNGCGVDWWRNRGGLPMQVIQGYWCVGSVEKESLLLKYQNENPTSNKRLNLLASRFPWNWSWLPSNFVHGIHPHLLSPLDMWSSKSDFGRWMHLKQISW